MVAIVAITLTLAVLYPRPAAAQTAAVLLERARAQEQTLGNAPAPEAVRRAARAYELVVLRYPVSGLVDNALWQAAELLDREWARAADTRDRDEAVRYYAWLAKEYPSSPMAARARTRAAALKDAPGATPAPPPQPSPTGPRLTSATQPQPGQSGNGTIVVRSISRTPLPKGDRITVELSDETAYTGERVSNPDRVFFDFSNARTAASIAQQIRTLQSPLIKTVRVGSPTPGVTRVVLELQGSPRYSAFAQYNPYRLVIDVETSADPAVQSPSAPPAPAPTPGIMAAVASPPAAAIVPLPTSVPAVTPKPANTPVTTPTPTRAPATADASPVPPTSTGRGDYSLARQLGLRVAKVVIDPGHGGHDPGALANGVTESELVLDVALRLEALLEQNPGIEVVLTRRTNTFVPLEERTAIANRERADLFLSIHANSHRQPAVRGIETYFLNFATTPDAEAVAARENAASVQTMGTLPAIVKAISLNNKLDESREFAALLQSSLMKRMRTQSTAIRDLGVKQAPFVVLIGADMPSVLTEIAFLTNKAEAGLLKQPAHRQQIAQALRDAIVKYQGSLKRVSTAPETTRRE